MHYFEYRGGELHCEQVPLQRIADEVGTPAYIYSEQTLQRHVRVFDEAFQGVPHLICYAIKANSNINILRSEEHTSELQSQSNLVCRLLLEKKKITHIK